MEWNYFSIPKCQRCNRWGLGMERWFHPTLYWECNYLSMMGLKLNHVSKNGPWNLYVMVSVARSQCHANRCQLVWFYIWIPQLRQLNGWHAFEIYHIYLAMCTGHCRWGISYEPDMHRMHRWRGELWRGELWVLWPCWLTVAILAMTSCITDPTCA